MAWVGVATGIMILVVTKDIAAVVVNVVMQLGAIAGGGELTVHRDVRIGVAVSSFEWM